MPRHVAQRRCGSSERNSGSSIICLFFTSGLAADALMRRRWPIVYAFEKRQETFGARFLSCSVCFVSLKTVNGELDPGFLPTFGMKAPISSKGERYVLWLEPVRCGIDLANCHFTRVTGCCKLKANTIKEKETTYHLRYPRDPCIGSLLLHLKQPVPSNPCQVPIRKESLMPEPDLTRLCQLLSSRRQLSSQSSNSKCSLLIWKSPGRPSECSIHVC